MSVRLPAPLRVSDVAERAPRERRVFLCERRMSRPGAMRPRPIKLHRMESKSIIQQIWITSVQHKNSQLMISLESAIYKSIYLQSQALFHKILRAIKYTRFLKMPLTHQHYPNEIEHCFVKINLVVSL